MDFIIIIIIYQDWKTSLLTMLTNSKLSFFLTLGEYVPGLYQMDVLPKWSLTGVTSQTRLHLSLTSHCPGKAKKHRKYTLTNSQVVCC